jgi:hypothetical protein
MCIGCEIVLTKIEVAQRQLMTALRLFFADEDQVSIYTLASNAWEIIDALCNRRGTLSISNQSREHIAPEMDLLRDYINSPYRNYFKHADRDAENELPGLDDQRNDHLLFLAVEDYIRFNQRSPIEFQVYQLWYLAIYVEKVADDALERVMPGIDAIFSGIRERSRSDQKTMARNALAGAKENTSLREDPLTEEPFHTHR